eukprot:6039411-Pyramimonas_sp.AAC.1
MSCAWGYLCVEASPMSEMRFTGRLYGRLYPPRSQRCTPIIDNSHASRRCCLAQLMGVYRKSSRTGKRVGNG